MIVGRCGLAALATFALGAAGPSGAELRAWTEILFVFPLYLLLIAAPEASGWRGFVLPRLMESLGRLRATAVLGLIVAAWHVPLVVAGSQAAAVLATVFASQFVCTWLQRRTNGSVMVAHAARRRDRARRAPPPGRVALAPFAARRPVREDGPPGGGTLMNKPEGSPVSRIAQAYPDRVEVRGRDLAGDLMGRLTFTEYFHLLLTGEEPTEEQRFFLDLLLVSIAEHGLMPSNVAARMTLAADPGSLHGAVAAGILGAGPVVLGTSEECARLLAAGGEPAEIVREHREAGRKLPGFGHPVHEPVDPRAERILALSDERGVSGEHVARARALHAELGLVMNVSMPIAAVMLDLGFRPAAVKAVPILARTASLLAHLAEERDAPTGFALARAAEEAVAYEPDARA